MAKLLSQYYEITHSANGKSVTLYAEITSDDELSLLNQKKQPQFNFTKSDKDTVKAMALALFEAAELVDERKVKDGSGDDRA